MWTISHSKFTQTRNRQQAQTRDGHYVFWGWGAISPKKLCTAKTAEKKSRKFLLCLTLKNSLHKLLFTKEKSCATQRREKQIHAAENCPPPPKKRNSPSKCSCIASHAHTKTLGVNMKSVSVLTQTSNWYLIYIFSLAFELSFTALSWLSGMCV